MIVLLNSKLIVGSFLGNLPAREAIRCEYVAVPDFFTLEAWLEFNGDHRQYDREEGNHVFTRTYFEFPNQGDWQFEGASIEHGSSTRSYVASLDYRFRPLMTYLIPNGSILEVTEPNPCGDYLLPSTAFIVMDMGFIEHLSLFYRPSYEGMDLDMVRDFHAVVLDDSLPSWKRTLRECQEFYSNYNFQFPPDFPFKSAREIVRKFYETFDHSCFDGAMKRAKTDRVASCLYYNKGLTVCGLRTYKRSVVLPPDPTCRNSLLRDWRKVKTISVFTFNKIEGCLNWPLFQSCTDWALTLEKSRKYKTPLFLPPDFYDFSCFRACLRRPLVRAGLNHSRQ
jgi:hypothetical protein